VGECGELIASLALAISITLDPMSTGADVAAPPVENEAVSPSRGTEPAEHRADPPAGATASREPNGTPRDAPSATILEHSSQNADAATKRVSPERGLELNANLGMAAIVGVLPDPSPALRVGVEAQRGQGALSIELTGTPAVSQAGPASASADISLLLASAAPCILFGRLGACAVLSLGSWRGEGQYVAEPRVDSHFFASTGLRMMALLPLAGPLRLRLYAGGGATLTRPSFELINTVIWRPPPLSAEAGAALSLYFL
jgi:hypothetical protein